MAKLKNFPNNMYIVGLQDAPIPEQFRFTTAEVLALMPTKDRSVLGEYPCSAAALERQTEIRSRFLDLNKDGTRNEGIREGPMVVKATQAACAQAGWQTWETDKGFVLSCQARPTSDRVVVSYNER